MFDWLFRPQREVLRVERESSGRWRECLKLRAKLAECVAARSALREMFNGLSVKQGELISERNEYRGKYADEVTKSANLEAALTFSRDATETARQARDENLTLYLNQRELNRKLVKALTEISGSETPGMNGTVTRIIRIANKALVLKPFDLNEDQTDAE